MADRPYRWSPRAARYRDPRTGRFVSQASVRRALDGAIEGAEREVRRLADDLRERRISLAEWELAMRRQVKDVSLYSAAASKGGWAQLSPSDLGRVGAHVRGQYDYLRRFAQQIQSGEQPLDGRFAQRMSLYVRGGRSLYHRTEEREQALRGMQEKRNIRFPGDSCAGCIAAEAAGWVPIEGSDVPEIGERECRANCRCRWEYRAAA